MPDSTETMQRIEALEMRLAYQDRTVEELNATVTEFWMRIEQLSRQVKRLEEQLRETRNALPGPTTPEPPPPHY